MVKNINLKNNKGISLASVLVIVIIMLIILTSIVYSNARTNEIKKAMLINSDIEELTKKVEVYYLEKETLPMTKDLTSEFKYWEDTNTDGILNEGEAVYYRLQISLLDNVTLNNKEKIQNEADPTTGDQWYVINPETHTIYFVKYDNGIKIQKAQYSKNYEEIIEMAKGNITLNNTTGSGEVSENGGNTTLEAGTDELIEDTTSISIGTLYGDKGTDTAPGNPANDTGTHYDVYDYAQYEHNFKPGSTSTKMVLHYDGIYNELSGNSPSHSNISGWKDLSGNGNNGEIVQGSEIMSANVMIDDVSASKGTVDWMYKSELKITGRSTGKYSWGNNYLNLDDDSFVICKTPQNLPVRKSEYTVEVTFYYSGISEAKSGLVGMGIYKNAEKISNLDDRMTRAYNKAKIWHIINYTFFKKYEFYPYTQYPDYSTRSDNHNEIPGANGDNSGKANAIRINNDGNGIYQYYLDNDLDTGNKLTTGIHTVTTKYTNSNTYIYIDGVEITSKSSTPNTSDTKDYNKNRTDGNGVKNGTNYTRNDNELVQPVTIGASNLNVSTKLHNASNYFEDSCHFLHAKNYCYGCMSFTLAYKEFFDGNIYSVRISNTALSDDEIYKNYRIDKIRFNF